jgi:hypothetical protein
MSIVPVTLASRSAEPRWSTCAMLKLHPVGKATSTLSWQDLSWVVP